MGLHVVACAWGDRRRHGVYGIAPTIEVIPARLPTCLSLYYISITNCSPLHLCPSQFTPTHLDRGYKSSTRPGWLDSPRGTDLYISTFGNSISDFFAFTDYSRRTVFTECLQVLANWFFCTKPVLTGTSIAIECFHPPTVRHFPCFLNEVTRVQRTACTSNFCPSKLRLTQGITMLQYFKLENIICWKAWNRRNLLNGKRMDLLKDLCKNRRSKGMKEWLRNVPIAAHERCNMILAFTSFKIFALKKDSFKLLSPRYFVFLFTMERILSYFYYLL